MTVPDAERPRALEGRSIVIVGGTSGIGLSAARACVCEGARIVVLGLPESIGSAGEALEGTIVIGGDATDPAIAEHTVRAAVQAFGGLDGLLHVAGGSGRRFGDGPLHELSDEGWQATIDLNLTSVFLSNRAAVRQFLRQGRGGVVLNTTSVLAWSPSADHFATHAYTAAKAAIVGLTRACAARYARDGIRFNAIAPGLTDTPMARRAATDPTIQAYIRSRQPLDGGRMGRAEDLDGAVVFLLSDAARFVTGQVLAVDGGWTVS